MSSYQYRKPHCGDKTILRPSYLHNGISYTVKTTSLYWIRALLSYWVFQAMWSLQLGGLGKNQVIKAEWRIYASIYKTISGSDNASSPLQHQAIIIIWTKAGLLSLSMESEGDIGMGLSVCSSHILLWFPCFSKQTTQGIDFKLLWYSPGPLDLWSLSAEFLTFAQLLNGWAASIHLWTNHWFDWTQIWWSKLLWASSGLIDFWSFPLFHDLWFIELGPVSI